MNGELSIGEIGIGEVVAHSPLPHDRTCGIGDSALGSVRSGTSGSAVDGCTGGEDGADNRSAWGTDHDANKRANSARGAPQETGIRAGGGTNAGPDGSAGYETDKGMSAALWAGGCRDPDDVLAFYRDVGAVFSKREQFIGDGDKFSAVALQAGFDHFDSLAGLQSI